MTQRFLLLADLFNEVLVYTAVFLACQYTYKTYVTVIFSVYYSHTSYPKLRPSGNWLVVSFCLVTLNDCNKNNRPKVLGMTTEKQRKRQLLKASEKHSKKKVMRGTFKMVEE